MPLDSIPSTTKENESMYKVLKEIKCELRMHKKPGVVAHACNPSIWEAETGGLRFEDSLSYSVRLSTN